MRRLGLATAALVVTMTASLFAAPLPPGGEEINSLLSPLFLGGSPSVTSTASPQADVINPAASGAAQRAVVDLSYLGIMGVASPFGYNGTIANLGLTYPTDYGVYSASAHFLGTGTALGLGTIGLANFSFSKDLYSNFLVGAGLGFTLGVGPSPSPGVGGDFDWGLGLSLGFLALPGDVGILKDFRWGAAFDNIGKGFAPANSPYAAYPAPFTPAIGAGFSLLKTKGVNLGFDSTLSFPTFSDVRLDLGSTLTINHAASLHLATALSLNNVLQPATYPGRFFPHAGGITLSFTTTLPSNLKYLSDKGWTRSEVNPTVSVAPLENNELAIGGGVNIPLGQIDTTPPVITMDYPKPQWIAPKNGGAKNYLDVPIKIVDNRFVYGYQFKVFDSDGKLVRQIDNPDFRPESQGVQNIIDRLVAVKKGIPIPPTFLWDGKNNLGQVVPDGAYTFTITAWDENGNTATSSPATVHVKDTPPQLTLKPITGDALIFSPGSGLKNSLEITQTGSRQSTWTGEFLNSSGKAVRTIVWKDSAPQSFLWEGTDDAGKVVPDGVYSYHIEATDQAGNTTRGSIQNIIVNTVATPVQLSISPAAFAPGTKSPIQTITFSLGVPVRTDIVSWSLKILDANGTVVRTISGGSDIPTMYIYDGKADDGAYLAQGTYHGVLSVLYRNGHNPQATSPAINVDLTPPSAHLTADYLVFSPIGNSPRENMIFHATASEEQSWTGLVESADGLPVRTYQWVGEPDSTITWDGRGDNGRLEPDGTYKFLVESVDEAGNFGESNTITFTLDTENKQVFLTNDYNAFSPNGKRNVIHLVPQLKTTNGFVSYSFDVIDKSGNILLSSTGTTPPTGAFSWNGTKPDGSLAPDGLYRGELNVSYTNGATPKAVTGWFLLTTKLPSVEVQASERMISLNAESRRKSITFTQSSSTTTTIWTGEIQRANGQVIREWKWPSTVKSFIWDGTDAYGNPVQDGTYAYRVSTTDEAGNYTQAAVKDIVVDSRPTHAYITVSRSGFAPNGSGVADSVSFSPLLTLRDGVESWDLAMIKSDGTVVKDFTGSGSPPPASIVWDGKSSSGQIVEGSYVGRLTVTYLKGDVDEATTREFVLDVTPPQVSVQLSPIPFTPDNSGVGNILSIGLVVKAPVAIDTWSLEISDPTGQPFYSFSGTGMPASTLYWNGLSSSGELVQSATDYPYVLTVRDVLGNTRIVKGNIPVGVLVMKEGDKYLIRVSSIHFAPYSSALITKAEDPVLYAQNMHVLDLIAETLKRYSSYDVRLEGNAVSVYWYDPAKAAAEQRDVLIPLSLARAQSVKQALVERGVPADRMTAIGLGAANPIVPFSDTQNLWKDRRVDFVLLKD